MAIGSAPEIGATFTTWGKMDEASRMAWFNHLRTAWAGNILAGYATLCQPDSERMERINKEWSQV